MKQRAIGPADLAQIAQVPLFSRIGQDHLASLCGRGTVRVFDAPTLLFSTGDPADGFFVVLAGRVHLATLTVEGAEAVVTVVEAGETFAEAAMFGSGRFPVNAEAQPGAEVVRIERAPFEAALRATPDLAFRMLDALIARQHFLIAEVSQLKSQSPAQRLASYLLALLESGRWSGHGRLPHAKQVIASRIGIDPASLSRALRRLDSAGIVCEGEEVIITDPARLRDFCAGSTR
jgi:CRP-like cAMP-binding protein